MPEVKALLDAREYEEATRAREGRSWRKILLGCLGVKETPRKLGRPKR